MPFTAREDTTPLLGEQPNKLYGNLASDNRDDRSVDRITVLTSDPEPVAQKPDDVLEGDDLVAKRLNGSPLLAILFGIWISVCLGALDSTIVATVYPLIGSEFKRSNEIIWIATSYMLSFTALQPLYGRISDVFGRKSALLFAMSIFFIGSLLCGAASSFWYLVAARTIAGIGAGGINTLGTIITSDLISQRERGKYQGYGNVAFGFGSVLGAPLGGFLSDRFGWRYCFYINIPPMAITIVMVSCYLTNYNTKEQKNSTLWERVKKIDYAGSITVVASVTCFLLASAWGGNSLPWTDPLVLGCLISSIILAVVFCVIEAKYAANPLMPWHIISAQTPLACCMVNFWTNMCSLAVIYLVPLYFQGLRGYSATEAGLYFLPRVVAVSTGSISAGIYMSRTGEYRSMTIYTSVISFVAMLGFVFCKASSPSYLISLFLFFDGLSAGALVTATLVAMLACVGSKEMATITSVSYLFRAVASVIGISATSAIFQAVVKHILTERISGPDAAKYIEIARKSMTEIRQQLPSDILAIVLETYEVALKYAFMACAAMAFLSVISTIFIQRIELQTKVR